MRPTDDQIKLYKKLEFIASKHHAYTDQMMAIAMYVDRSYTLKVEEKTTLLEYIEEGNQSISLLQGLRKALPPGSVSSLKPYLSRKVEKDALLEWGKSHVDVLNSFRTGGDKEKDYYCLEVKIFTLLAKDTYLVQIPLWTIKKEVITDENHAILTMTKYLKFVKQI